MIGKDPAPFTVGEPHEAHRVPVDGLMISVLVVLVITIAAVPALAAIVPDRAELTVLGGLCDQAPVASPVAGAKVVPFDSTEYERTGMTVCPAPIVPLAMAEPNVVSVPPASTTLVRKGAPSLAGVTDIDDAAGCVPDPSGLPSSSASQTGSAFCERLRKPGISNILQLPPHGAFRTVARAQR